MKKKAKASPLLAKMLSATANSSNTTSHNHSPMGPIEYHVDGKQLAPAYDSNSLMLKEAAKIHQQGKLDEAATQYRQILQDSSANIKDRAQALSLMGTVYLQKNQFEEALKYLSEALVLSPNDAIAHNNLGVTYKQLEDKEAAMLQFKEAVRLKPDYPDALNNYGAALIGNREIDQAIYYLDKAIALKPDYADSHYNRGTAFQTIKQFDEAEASFERALAINPNFTSALFNSGLLRLLRGEFEEGWRLYEYRWQDNQAKRFYRDFPQPLWLGDTNLTGKTIFLYTEQGLGDFIQFYRYVAMVEKLAKHVTLLAPQELVSLVKPFSPNVTLIPRTAPDMQFECNSDFHCPILSLPLAFKTTLATIPANVPYIAAPQDKLQLWQQRLATLSGKNKLPRIGLVWSGAAGHLNDFNRSIQLKSLAPFLPKIAEYHVLQKEIRPADIETLQQLKEEYRIHSHCDELLDFCDTAALIQHMDLIISVDTSVAHLAGALAKPLWILIPFFPDFRWLLDREDSPWYPTARLFRQDQANDWSTALQRLGAALDQQLRSLSSYTPDVLRAKINHALSQHNAGKFQEAEQMYLQILQHAPDYTEVLTLLASLYLQQESLDQSEEIFRRSLALDAKNPLTLHNYGLLQEKLDRNDEAIKYMDAALAITPTYEDAYRHKANLLKKVGDLAAIVPLYQAALRHIPQSADMHFRLANALRDADKPEQALEAINHAIAFNGELAQSYNNRGNIYLDLKKPDLAIKDYQQALAINPNYANAYNNSANAYLALNQYEHAVAACDAALTINPGLLTTLNNRANALQKLKRFDEALAAYDRVIDEHKDYSFAPLNKGLLCLLLGRFTEGWPLYEARWHAAPQPRLSEVFKSPLWLGKESLKGKIILLHAEQGYGDSIQFCRYVALVAKLGAAKVYLNVPKLIAVLVKESFALMPPTQSVIVLTDGDKIPQYDYQCPLMSLPLAFGTDLSNIPAGTPYLFANNGLIKKWHVRLGKKLKPRIGLVWSGSSAYSNDSNRSIALEILKPLFSLDVEFHSLQKDIKSEDAEVFSTLKIQNHQQHLINFSETAALIHEMDLVISVDTSVAHLAGALNKPVWIFLPFVPDFRWLLDRDDSPWYPSARLFRQIKSGNWHIVVQKLTQAINSYFELSGDVDVSYNNQGNALASQGLLHEAVDMYELEIAINPANAIAHNNLGSALQRLGQFETALQSFDNAIQLSENYVTPKLNKAFLKLSLGELAEGWELYEWRWKNDQWRDAYRTFTQPLWTESANIKGKTIFIYPEQGYGDYIQLSRYFSLLLKAGANVIAEVPAPLATLMQDSFADIHWHEAGNDGAFDLLQFDYQCPIFSLPLAFKTTLENIPNTIPYLNINHEKQIAWRESLPLKTRPRVGIVWSSTSAHRNSQNRNITTNDILNLLQQGYEFHILQKQLSRHDLTSLNILKQFGHPIFLYQNRLHDFVDTAALIKEMDLIVTVDTSVAHLAGALGKPVWILLPDPADFRWLLNRNDSPWYPSARLFRQEKSGDWSTVLKRVSDSLKNHFKR